MSDMAGDEKAGDVRSAIEAEDEALAGLDVPSGVRRVPRPNRAYDKRGNVRPADGRDVLTGEAGEDARVNAPSRPADKHIQAEVLEKEKRATAVLQSLHKAPARAQKAASK